MIRYIDGTWLLNFFVGMPDDYTLTVGNLRAVVNDAPSIDIVRCKECKYRGTWKCMIRDMYVPREPKLDDFCSYGEREGE